ncbi:peptidase M20 [Williamsoniiplasma somnilux]|uniref:Peptidase M20 n=1 Tax=Williamsoniiplasma somnilux TaxID=215578 RepID=A0A2K8NY16_9MOLU|nr:Sapep family Mn(2+)-dependent dipeptidase [Williamsoniiplasma somnilux]ATZ18722.1 peptidase M20 [Williamsoniiplasma somnilux]
MKINENILNSKYFDEALEHLLKVLAIPSEQGEPVKGAVFGAKTKEALEYTLNLAKKWGLKTHLDADGSYGFLEYGQGSDVFLIAPHLDVVTAANPDKWEHHPYKPIIKDDKIYARGALDDKGPAYMVLFAFKYLMDNGWMPKNYLIRIVFGLDEEKEMRCLKKYVRDFGAPTIGFTPDGVFPCVYAEKAWSNVNLTGKYNSSLTIRKGIESQDYNVVIDHVIYNGDKTGEIAKYLTKHKIENQIINSELHVFGKPAHGSMPELGVNAAIWLLKAIDEVKIHHPLAEFVSKYFFDSYDVKKIFGDLTDETGGLTACIGYIKLEKDKYKLGINFRVPATKLDQIHVIAPLEQKTEPYKMKVAIKGNLIPIFFRKDRKIVKTMVEVYNKVTGNNLPPFPMGGGTYAKVVPNLIACGIIDNLDNASAHQYNEWVDIENLKRALNVYANLIVELEKS